MPKKIEISHRSVIFAVLFLLFLWLLFQIRTILVSLFVAIVLMSALNQLVERLIKWRIPRSVSIILVYILLIASIALSIGVIIPPLVEQSSVLINRFPEFIHAIGITGIDPTAFQDQLSQFGIEPSNILRFGFSIVGNILNIIAILVLTFYLLLERRKLDDYLGELFVGDENKRVNHFINELERNMGSWVRGEIILMTIIGVFTYIGLLVLGIPYALPLAIFAGIMEIVPNFGPIVSGIPAVITGFAISPITGFAVLALYFLIQQLENMIIVPKVIQKTIGFNPVVSLIVLMIGFKLGGAFGALLSIPFTLALKVIFKEFIFGKKLPKMV